MRGFRWIFVLIVLVVATVGAVYWSDRAPEEDLAANDETVFPSLFDRINEVARIRIEGADDPFHIVRADDAWMLEEKDGYPAARDRVHRLLLGGASLKYLEPKTSRPEYYSELGVEDPDEAGADSLRIRLESAAGEELARWVLGNRRTSGANRDRSELYVRIADDPQVWLVEGSVPSGRSAVDWAQRDIVAIPVERTRRVTLRHSDGDVIEVSKADPADSEFTLQDIPEGREVDAAYRIADIGGFIQDLRLDDVRSRPGYDEEEFDADNGLSLSVVTFDGLRVIGDLKRRDSDGWLVLRAEVDEETFAAESEREASAQDDDGADAAENGEEAADESDAEASEDTLDREAIVAEVESLNERWSKWAYKLPSYKVSYITVRMEGLTRIPESESESEEG
ncbi:DUF4340 domain-containing protein [Thioalkalivibrio sp. HK1]|uniref:DUF4340 domain-containing protein n=1 Tax=Thioalkalivibrio sp. HK1 TaxID=1469245 RepID=UPI00046FB47B|nr:DUF4340 domain-containing protein [Thioalkalivibrio sp. HK1]